MELACGSDKDSAWRLALMWRRNKMCSKNVINGNLRPSGLESDEKCLWQICRLNRLRPSLFTRAWAQGGSEANYQTG